MTSITERIALIEALTAELKSHPACAQFKDTGTRYQIMLPPGLHPYLDGIQASYITGKAKALGRLIAKAEQVWNESRL
ncbi:MAG: hypothetical protein M0P09_01360 [Acholeplasmataceae bacterium]|nr:hypothetical protein [Acholeplasmataceae bacterium]